MAAAVLSSTGEMGPRVTRSKEEKRKEEGGKYMKYAFIFIFAFNFAKIMRADEIRSVTTGRE